MAISRAVRPSARSRRIGGEATILSGGCRLRVSNGPSSPASPSCIYSIASLRGLRSPRPGSVIILSCVPSGFAGGTLIVGLGVDISEVNRIESAIQRHGDAFLKRVFTPAEIAYCERHRNRFERYAGRFAAKEATMKALG